MNRLRPDTENNDSDETITNNRKSPSPYAKTSRESSPLSSSAHQFNMATSSGTKLAQEIHDEFLCCKICLEGYKSPKCLNCLHTFCEQCIENHVASESTYKKYSDYRDFTCPLCRKRTQLPIGGVKKLPDNFLVSSLSEVVVRQKPSKYPFCDICKQVNRKCKEATSKCLDCNKLLCTSCLELHKATKVTANHNIFDVEIEKDIECKEHQDEAVRFYCEPCETCICVLCTFNEHRDHEISQFGEAVVKYKENIASLVDISKSKVEKYDSQAEQLTNCEKTINSAEQLIHETAINFIQEIRTKEKKLVEDLQAFYGKETMEFIEHRNEMSNKVDSLRSTCSLTSVILKGKDIELLLLKKDVQEKLSSLNDIEIKDLPPSVNKVVTFAPGGLELGILRDPLDKADQAAKRRSRVMAGGGWPSVIKMKDNECQTDAYKISHRTRQKSDRSDTTATTNTSSEEETSSSEEEVKQMSPVHATSVSYVGGTVVDQATIEARRARRRERVLSNQSSAQSFESRQQQQQQQTMKLSAASRGKDNFRSADDASYYDASSNQRRF